MRTILGSNPIVVLGARTVLITAIGLCFASFLLYLITKPQTWLNATGHKWNTATNGTQLYYHYVTRNPKSLSKVTKSLKTQDGVILEYNWVQYVALNFGSIFLAAVCSYLLWAIRDLDPRKRNPTSIWTRAKILGKRILFFQLFPRRFWVWWCGGLHVLDFLLVLTWLGFSLMWVYFTVHPKYISIRAQIKAGKTKPHAAHLNMMHQTSSAIGTSTQFSMILLFLPVTRNSFLQYIFNSDFSGLNKYHRWLGYGLAWIVIVHGSVYYAYWSLNTAGGTFRSYFFKWGNDHSNNLAGSIAGFFTLIILFSSWSWVRRTYFQVFIRAHAIGYVGFLIFTYIHFWARWYHQTPGLVLLALDWTFRLVQWLHPSWVTGKFVTGDKSIVTLEFKWKKSALPRPGQSMWINTPAGRRSQWHPVSIADVDTSSPCAIVTAHMKCYGNWTTDMIAQMVQRGKIMMRVEGPYGQPYGPRWNRYNVIVILAGGIGVTPMLGMLRDISAQRRRALALKGSNGDWASPFPQKIYLHWSCRGMAEFALLDADLLNVAQEKAGWLELNLYSTRELTGDGVHTDLDYEDGLNKLIDHQSGTLHLPKHLVPLGHTPRTASAFGFKPRALEGQGGIFLRIVALTLAFVGAFFMLLMAMTYDKNLGITTGGNKANYKTGILVIVGSIVGAMGLPSLILYPYAAIRYRLSAKDRLPSSRSGDFKVNEDEGNDGTQPQIMSADHVVGTEEAPSAFQVQSGRPDIKAILDAAANRHSDQTSIGVFVAGPESMTGNVKLAAATYNDGWQSPYLDFSSHAFDL